MASVVPFFLFCCSLHGLHEHFIHFGLHMFKTTQALGLVLVSHGNLRHLHHYSWMYLGP
jgi:hypothetical protein